MADNIIREPAFWVNMAFLTFVAIVVWKGRKGVKEAFDARIMAIKAELEQAQTLREEAATLLTEAEERENQMDEVGDKIIAEAKKIAEFIRKEGQEVLQKRLDLKKAHFEHRLLNIESEAVDMFRQRVSAVALQASKLVLEEALEGELGDALTNNAIEKVADKIVV